jgi:hypothetical protein
MQLSVYIKKSGGASKVSNSQDKTRVLQEEVKAVAKGQGSPRRNAATRYSRPIWQPSRYAVN